MSAARELPARPSLDSLRKQAKRTRPRRGRWKHRSRRARSGAVAAVDPPSIESRRAARHCARIRVRRLVGAHWPRSKSASALDSSGRRPKHRSRSTTASDDHLRTLLSQFPSLVSWRDERDQTLLDSTTSYAMDV